MSKKLLFYKKFFCAAAKFTVQLAMDYVIIFFYIPTYCSVSLN